jgi:hypothetical protein
MKFCIQHGGKSGSSFASSLRVLVHNDPPARQAATERFLDAAEPDPPPPTMRRRVREKVSDWVAASFINTLTGSEAVRCLVGGGGV